MSMPVVAAKGVVPPAASNLAATVAATDYVFAWQSSFVNHVLLQNNTAAVLNYEIDGVATAGSPALAAGAAIFLDIQMAALHLLTAGIQNVNGAAAANIVIRAWL